LHNAVHKKRGFDLEKIKTKFAAVEEMNDIFSDETFLTKLESYSDSGLGKILCEDYQAEIAGLKSV
jgi:hypothetical protein